MNHILYRNVRIALLLQLLMLCICNLALGQEEAPYRINGWWNVDGDSVRITYDMSVPLDKTYDVRVIFKKDGDTTFSVIPKSANGALGKIYFNGGTLEINWDYKKDVSGELEGKYRFDFVITEIEEGGWKWWHYAAGGAAVVAGTIVAITSGGKESTLPGPPRIRP